FHNLITASGPVEASVLPSRENASVVTASSLALIVRWTLLDCESIRTMFPFSLPVATTLPSGDRAITMGGTAGGSSGFGAGSWHRVATSLCVLRSHSFKQRCAPPEAR